MTSLTVHTRPRDPAAEKVLRDSGTPTLLAQLLASRGVNDPEVARLTLTRMTSDRGMLGLPEAANRIADAVMNNERILILGDFDCDGATGTAVAVEGLTMLGAKQVDFLLPNRIRHGYGLSRKLIPDIVAKNPSLLITVDNGIAASDGVVAARENGIDVVVTDHHLPGNATPNCIIVNPNQNGCPHPGKNLAGVGVMFYTLGAIKRELMARGWFAGPAPDLKPLLDLVALGTVADVVKLDENNRILVKNGLALIRAGKARPGIKALYQIAGKNEAIASAEDFGFALGPRINAAGRLDDMTWGVRCLLTDDMDTALHYAQELDNMNQSRKVIEADMQEEAEAVLAAVDPAEFGHAVVLYGSTWHQGVVGLLASRVKDAYHKPVLAMTDGDPGYIKGSGRSIPGLHLRDALDLVDKRYPGVLVKFGGHAMAAGFTINAHKLDELRLGFELVVREMLAPEDMAEVVETDGELDLNLLTQAELRAVRDSVWGQGFAAPLFVGEFEVSGQRLLKEAHSKMDLVSDGVGFPAIMFRHIDTLPEKIRVIYRPVLNTFKGKTTVEAIIEKLITYSA